MINVGEGQVMTVTTQTIPGYEVTKVFGIVSGMTARTRGVAGKVLGGIESFLGGEVSAFTSELETARQEALGRMAQNARGLGANAVVSVDFETTEVFDFVVLVSALGTAVTMEKSHG